MSQPCSRRISRRRFLVSRELAGIDVENGGYSSRLGFYQGMEKLRSYSYPLASDEKSAR